MNINVSNDTILNELNFVGNRKKWTDTLNIPRNIMDNFSVRLNITENETDSPAVIKDKIEIISKSQTDFTWTGYKDVGKSLFVDSEYIKSFIGFKTSNNLSFSDIKLSTQNNSSVILVPLDNKPIEYSKQLILTAVGRQNNTGQINHPVSNNLINLGKSPILLENIDLVLSYKNKRIRPRVFSLDPLGQRSSTVNSRNTAFYLKGVNSPWFEIVVD